MFLSFSENERLNIVFIIIGHWPLLSSLQRGPVVCFQSQFFEYYFDITSIITYKPRCLKLRFPYQTSTLIFSSLYVTHVLYPFDFLLDRPVDIYWKVNILKIHIFYFMWSVAPSSHLGPHIRFLHREIEHTFVCSFVNMKRLIVSLL